MDAKTLAEIVGGRWENLSDDLEISNVSLNSQTLKKGEMFVALKTSKRDGHDFIEDAFDQGAVAALVSQPHGSYPCLVVEDPESALRQWAWHIRQSFQGTVIGVVGSVGKTTAKELLAHLIGTCERVHASPKSFNNHLGVPLTFIAIPPETKYLVVEMGASAPGDLDSLGSLVRPDHLFVTPIAEVHLKGFGSLEGVYRSKGEILNHLNPEGWLAYPLDSKLQASWPWTGSKFLWEAKGTDLFPVSSKVDFPQTIIEFVDLTLKVNFPSLWIGPLLAGIRTFLSHLNLQPNHASLSEFCFPDSRLEVLNVNEVTIINDAWNASPVSVKHSLKVLEQAPGRHVFVLGEMAELGSQSSLWHQRIGEACRDIVDLLVCIGSETQKAAEAFNGLSRVFVDVEDCEKHLPDLVGPGDVILVKGSRFQALDQLANRLVPRRVSA